VLSLAPSVLVMVTSFTRRGGAVAAALGLGTDGTAERRDRQPGAVPHRFRHGADLARIYAAGSSLPSLTISRGSVQLEAAPFRVFMLGTREKDLTFFVNLSKEPPPASPDATSLTVLVPPHDLGIVPCLRDRLSSSCCS
jgi:flagellar biosynthetic protein FliP